MKPGFFDVQVNGYAGVDFNQNTLTGAELQSACERLQHDGIEGILATIITADIPDMMSRIVQIVRFREEDPLIRQVVRGIHVEGPFLNGAVGYRGAHPSDHIKRADSEAMRQLLDAGDGLVRLVTLAPEVDEDMNVTRMLSSEGVVVSAGHCDPRRDELQAAIDAGLSMFTHLGNGCPQTMPRHDNIVQRALSLADQLWLCFIADGVHIPFFALENYLKLAPLNNVIVTTDAMAGAGAARGRYTLGEVELDVGDDRIVREPGASHFAGSAVDMKTSFANLITEIGLSEDDARKLTCDNPRKALEIE